jgi:NAD(P)-dependent dehydrogenase (short-subunit alcohol dehydrogenase family)
VRADVSDEGEVSALAAWVMERFGRLHLLVNNAGEVRRARTEEVELAEWRRILDVNLTGTFLCTRHLLPALRAAGGAAVVNVSSIAGVMGGVLGPHYAAAKGGIIALTKFWARELLPHKIRVNAVAPAMIDTEMSSAMWPGPQRDALERQLPMGRFARPEEVASVIVFLAGDESSYMTGECLNVTGGF